MGPEGSRNKTVERELKEQKRGNQAEQDLRGSPWSLLVQSVFAVVECGGVVGAVFAVSGEKEGRNQAASKLKPAYGHAARLPPAP